MTHPQELSLTPLARRALLSLPGGTGKAVGVFSGLVWITEAGVLDDHVLGPGDSLALLRPGLVLVEALQDSQLIYFDTDASAAARRHPMPGAGTSAVLSTALPGGPARGLAAGSVEHARPTRAEVERIAKDLRRQAMDDAATRLVRALRALGRWVTSPASPRAAMPRPGGPALAAQAQR